MNEYRAKQILEQNHAVYNTIAADFSRTRGFLWADLHPLKEYAKDVHTVVDIGCGNGRLYQLFSHMDVNYIGIDFSEELVAIARNRFPGARFFVSNMIKTSLQDSMADVIYCIAAFQHLPSREMRIQALQEMRRVLKPGGSIVMMNWNLFSDWAREKYESDGSGDFFVPWKNEEKEVLGLRYYHGFLLEELHELVQSVGLNIVKQHYCKKGEVSSLGPGENIITVMRAAEDV